jgi:FkbM family methyltransferase
MLEYHWVTECARQWFKPANEFSMIGFSVPLGPHDVAIDCGANVGIVSSRLARTGATVYAFEPNPECFQILKSRFKFVRQVRCVNAGVMDRHCTLKFTVPEAHESYDRFQASLSGSFEEVLDLNRYLVKEFVVSCIDLSDFVFSIGRVKFIKLDIEGSEIAVINRLLDTGAIELIDLIGVETHERLSENLRLRTKLLRERIAEMNLTEKICMEWH